MGSEFATWAFLAANMAMGAVFGIVDEPIHIRRDLGAWERIGHPIDTLAAVAAYATAYFSGSPQLYGGLALLAMGLSLKDEWVHHSDGTAAENFVHGIMFILTGMVHMAGMFLLLLQADRWPFAVAAALGLVVLVWQVGYWLIWRRGR